MRLRGNQRLHCMSDGVKKEKGKHQGGRNGWAAGRGLQLRDASQGTKS